ncbi:hypothetical protein AVEN_139142-1 [Araneus ventricosus]|uniref:RNase H type-1 domain-containing protein n=1 Tax=Araneus ventricosus TaxID=182803 RepID=A0A4Y2ARL1_ARAVE|nr:hypothetical protein AVEN_58887-1 [Araneus ventricosus]GBL82503.1 hypothetical protein AVEN_139142-1 [Araneus ventricosus]
MPPRLLHRPSILEPGGRQSAPAGLAPRCTPAGRNCDYKGIHFYHESYEQPSPQITHPVLFNLEEGISQGEQGPSNRTLIEVYTNGSKMNDQTGSAFCAIEKEAVTKTWKAELSPANIVLEAEMLALKPAIKWDNTANKEVNIWRDSASRL